MNVLNKIFNAVRLDDEDDYDEFEPDEEFDDLDYTEKSPSTKKNSASIDDTLLLDDEDEDEEQIQRHSMFRSSKKQTPVTPIKSARASMEVCMIRPNSLNDEQEICDTLLSGRAVVINLEGFDIELSQRIIDFIAGSCYAMKGNLQAISRAIYIVTPNSIDLTGDFGVNTSRGE